MAVYKKDARWNAQEEFLALLAFTSGRQAPDFPMIYFQNFKEQYFRQLPCIQEILLNADLNETLADLEMIGNHIKNEISLNTADTLLLLEACKTLAGILPDYTPLQNPLRAVFIALIQYAKWWSNKVSFIPLIFEVAHIFDATGKLINPGVVEHA